MAHFSKIENGIVTQVIVVSNDNAPGEFPDSEAPGVAFCKMLFGNDTEWKQTSYNNSFRYRYAGIGFTYDEVRDAFIAPQPFSSWILNENTLEWEAPIAYPGDDESVFYWDEGSISWKEII